LKQGVDQDFPGSGHGSQRIGRLEMAGSHDDGEAFSCQLELFSHLGLRDADFDLSGKPSPPLRHARPI
jgi:hypothetical protein